MDRLCIKDCIIDGLIFVSGLNYKIEFNSFTNSLVIYHPFGYTTINKHFLDNNFL